MVLKIEQKTKDATINIALDTIKINKQALVFANTKRSAEKSAEDIANKLDKESSILNKLSDDLLHSISNPTKQCKRLAKCAKKGIVFHHAGLTSTQRNLIEDNFRLGNIKIICATPTLAAGVDLPAFRTILKNLTRYGHRGMYYIPVLEYLQMAGRAGRPGKEDYGEAIILAGNDVDKEDLTNKYVYGEPEHIYSKLAVEPVLRTYILSLVSSGFVRSQKELIDFFSDTFWAHQFEDMHKLESILNRMINLLKEYDFLEKKADSEGFMTGDELYNEKLIPTDLGVRVAELYIDPLTAHHIIDCMRTKKTQIIAFLHMICLTLEMKPLLKVTAKDYEDIQEKLNYHHGKLMIDEPVAYEEEYDDYLNAFKTSLMLLDWCDEKGEEYLLERYNVRPGELNAKLDRGDWLIYSAVELAKILNMKTTAKELAKARTRMKYGVSEDLLPLLKLKNIGRVRARKMFNHRIKTFGDIKKTDAGILAKIIGSKAVAIDIKKQLGQEVDEKKIEEKKSGQHRLSDY